MIKNDQINLIPAYSDYIGLISTISKTFAESSGIDIDEFKSLAGERWTRCIHIFKPEKGKFITLFLYDFKYRCVALIIKENRKRRSLTPGTKIIYLDKINKHNQSKGEITKTTDYKIIMSDFALLSDSAKYMIKCLYSIESEKPKQLKQDKQDLYTKVNKMVKTKYSRKEQVSALHEIAELIGGNVSKNNKPQLRTITFQNKG